MTKSWAFSEIPSNWTAYKNAQFLCHNTQHPLSNSPKMRYSLSATECSNSPRRQNSLSIFCPPSLFYCSCPFLFALISVFKMSSFFLSPFNLSSSSLRSIADVSRHTNLYICICIKFVGCFKRPFYRYFKDRKDTFCGRKATFCGKNRVKLIHFVAKFGLNCYVLWQK